MAFNHSNSCVPKPLVTALNLLELTLIQRLDGVNHYVFLPPQKKKKFFFFFFCIQFHAYTHFRIFNSGPMPVNMLLLACEIITLKRNLNFTADRALWKWFSEYIALICECRHSLAVYASFAVTESHLKQKMKTTLKEIRHRCFTVSLPFNLSLCACYCPSELHHLLLSSFAFSNISSCCVCTEELEVFSLKHTKCTGSQWCPLLVWVWLWIWNVLPDNKICCHFSEPESQTQ